MIFDQLRDDLGIAETELTKLIDSAPARYKTYQIPKRGRGHRVIAQPAREIKVLQYYILENLIARLPVHDIAMAYRVGRSIRDNAKAHRRNSFILKLDFRSFFNSLTPNDMNRCFRLSDVELETGDARVINKILFWSGSKSKTPRFLSVGAPSSPAVSNAIMFQTDVAAAELAFEEGVTITRYADDISASSNEAASILRFERRFRRLISATAHPKLTFNDDKRGLYSRGERRMVTGLVITPANKVSIGRDRKRKISSMIHQAILQRLNSIELNELHGLLAFANSAEPKFIRSMSTKYEIDVIAFVRRTIQNLGLDD